MAADAPRIERHRSLDSTQERAHRLAAAGAPHGTVVVAAEQTRGRGTRGRPWHSGQGGLWLTAVLRPGAAPPLEGLSIRVGLAIAAVLDPLVTEPIRLKWPNDLFGLGRKLGGILCEARWLGDQPGWVAVGVGLNGGNEIPAELALTAVGLAALGYRGDVDALIDPVARAVVGAGERTGPLSEEERTAFQRRDWLLGRRIRDPVAGTAAGVAADGRLIVLTDEGHRVPVLTGVVLAGEHGSR